MKDVRWALRYVLTMVTIYRGGVGKFKWWVESCTIGITMGADNGNKLGTKLLRVKILVKTR